MGFVRVIKPYEDDYMMVDDLILEEYGLKSGCRVSVELSFKLGIDQSKMIISDCIAKRLIQDPKTERGSD